VSDELPLFPLRTVLYPGGELPLRIFEPRYIGLVRDCMRGGHGFGVTPIRHGGEAGTPAEPHALGTVAEIVDFDQGRDGLLQILTRGARRFRLLEHSVNRERLLIGRIEYIEDEPPAPLPADMLHLKAVLQKVLELEAASAGRAVPVPESAAAVVYRLMERLPVPLARKLEVLSSASTATQLASCAQALEQLLQQGTD
jgi:Lon protease-like protein